MKTGDIRKANSLLENIQELECSIKQPIGLKVDIDWAYGCKVDPHRWEMLNALETARLAAEAVMKSAAAQQIGKLKEELKALGAEID